MSTVRNVLFKRVKTYKWIFLSAIFACFLGNKSWSESPYNTGELYHEDGFAKYYEREYHGSQGCVAPRPTYVSTEASVLLKNSRDVYIDYERAMQIVKTWMQHVPRECANPSRIKINIYFDGYVIDSDYYLQALPEGATRITTAPVATIERATFGSSWTFWTRGRTKTEGQLVESGMASRLELAEMLAATGPARQADYQRTAQADKIRNPSEQTLRGSNWPAGTDRHLWLAYATGAAVIKSEQPPTIQQREISRINDLLVASVELRSKRCGARTGSVELTWTHETAGTATVHVPMTLYEPYRFLRRKIGAYTLNLRGYMAQREAEVQPLLNAWGCAGSQWNTLDAGFKVIARY